MSEIALLIGRTRYEGWKSAAVARGIEHIAGGFELEVSERFPDDPVLRKIEPGESCSVELGGETVITGYIDSVDVSYSTDRHNVVVRGRDKTGDLVDCGSPPRQWLNRTLPQICADLCRPFGISVSSVADVGKPFRSFSVEQGDTVFDTISNGCRARALLPVSNGLGALVLTRAGNAQASGALVFGDNVLEAQSTSSHLERFSEYIVSGQQEYQRLWAAEISTEAFGRAADPAVRRHRPRHIVESGQLDSENASVRARWHAVVAAGRARRATYTVAGWRDGAGKLWTPNSMVQVNDPFAGIDSNLLITEVEHTRDRSGTRTRLTVTRREAYELIEIPEEDPFLLWNAAP